MPPPDRARDVLRCKVKARAWSLLAMLGGRLDKAIKVSAADGSHTVTVTVAPAERPPAVAVECFPGNHFSPLEASIYHALAGGPLLGKVIARRITQPYTPRLRTILANLKDRGVLTHNEEGYARADGAKGRAAASRKATP